MKARSWTRPQMHLPTHDRYPYSPISRRKPYDWPGGRRLAFYIGLNVEHFAFGEGLGSELVPIAGQPDVLNYTWRDYGNRVGVWRMIELLDELGLPCTALMNSTIYPFAPEIPAAFRARGDEIAAHGRSNSERQGALDEAAERALITETTETIAAAEGRPPRGWLGPWISQSRVTPDLLQEAGYSYMLDWCHDDQPIWMRTRGGRILTVPYPQELNDIPWIVRRSLDAGGFADMIVDQCDEMLRQCEGQPLVLGLALHTFIMGQPFRLKHLRRALRHVLEAGGDRLWPTTAGAIADHVLALPEDQAAPPTSAAGRYR
jgi:peptidoglycan/xylan/chitin deacetylase (PgdA/CDA1 family)